jgi:hypothetical protein
MMAGGIGLDPDAQAFLSAAGITDATITTAIDTLVIQLKAIGVWAKLKAIYPFVGGTATTHKFNLKNPADTNAAFRLSFVGGWTHSANGALPNGTNAYADTFLNQLLNGQQDSAHISYYSRTTSNGLEIEIGSTTNNFANGSLIEIRTSGITYYKVNTTSNYMTYTDPDAKGFYMANRTLSNLTNAWKNGIKESQASTASNTPANNNVYLGAVNNVSTPQFFTTKECALASIGDGLTDTEAANYYTAVQSFQTTLNRQV